MSVKTFKNYIKSIVREELTLLEKLRGNFNWEEFKKIKNNMDPSYVKDMDLYARQTLGIPIGKGSSRTVFALSSGKVLKLARWHSNTGAEKGRAQNKLEIETFTNPKVRPVVAKIFDYDPDYDWIVSEITRPFDESDRMEQALGMTTDSFQNLIIATVGNFKIRNFDQGWDSIVGEAQRYIAKAREEGKVLKKQYEELERMEGLSSHERRMREIDIWNKEKDLGYSIRHAEEILEKYSQAKVSRLKPLIDGIIAMRDQMGFNIDDLLRTDHYGLTADGRIVVIDYGYNLEIGRKFYGIG